MIEHLELRSGRYFDSVRLMQVSRQVTDVAGVEAALAWLVVPLLLTVWLGLKLAKKRLVERP